MKLKFPIVLKHLLLIAGFELVVPIVVPIEVYFDYLGNRFQIKVNQMPQKDLINLPHLPKFVLGFEGFPHLKLFVV